MPKLQVSLPDGSQRDHELTEQVVTIGRAQDNVLHIDDVSISSHHAQISPSPEGYLLKDLASTNGTRVNGNNLEPNTEYSLKAGDKIRFGKLDAVFDPEHAEAGAELPAADDRVVASAARSVKPSNFMNASPFQKRQAKKESINSLSMLMGGVAILAAVLLIMVLLALKLT